MKFYIEKKVFEKFPDIYVAIPIITGFNNKSCKEIEVIFRNAQDVLRRKFKDVDEYINDPRVSVYFDAFRKFGANPKKIKPTHYALGKRVIEGGDLPSINPVVDLYNAISVKYVTPFGGEDLSKVYGDFYMTLADGDEHWLGIGEDAPKSPKLGDLIWKDSYDVSTLSLNWRQCERTKLTEESTDGYFIMDGFVGKNDKNVLAAAEEFVYIFTKIFGGNYEIVELSKVNPEAKVDYETKSIEGVVLPKVQKNNKIKSDRENGKKAPCFQYDNKSIEAQLQYSIWQGLQSCGIAVNIDFVDIIPSRNKKFGDFSTTVCLRLGNQLKKNPIKIGEDLIGVIPNISKAEVVAPGFVNIYVISDDLKSLLLKIDQSWGINDSGKDRKIMVEFGQPNTHKELTMGHVKSGITGLSLSRLLEFAGYNVVKANYFGDIGLMVAKALWGLITKITPEAPILNLESEAITSIKKKCMELINEKGIKAVAKYFSDVYIFANRRMGEDKSVENQIREINNALYSKDNDGINEIYRFTRDLSIKYQNSVFTELGVKYDRQYPESENMETGTKIVKDSIGKVFDVDDGAVIFRGKKYGLKNFAFITSEGVPAYGAKDVGLAFKKFEEYPDLYLSIITTSAEQRDYFDSLIKSLELLDKKFRNRYKHIWFGWLLVGGKKTSSREGKAFTYEDILNELIEVSKDRMKNKNNYSEDEIESIAKNVAISSLKFGILSHEFHKDINYNPDAFLSMNGFSGPYILYTYARANSILNKGGKIAKKISDEVLNSSEEQDIIKKLIEFPKVVSKAQELYTPHLICQYVFELANLFNNFYNKHSVLNSKKKEEKNSKLLLVDAVSKVLKNGLYLLGIETVEKM